MNADPTDPASSPAPQHASPRWRRWLRTAWDTVGVFGGVVGVVWLIAVFVGGPLHQHWMFTAALLVSVASGLAYAFVGRGDTPRPTGPTRP